MKVGTYKSFAEPYSEAVKARIAGIEAQEYTRMGFAIRHLTHLLGEIEAKTRVLITLSDGRPEDYGGYKGKYGIDLREDKMAAQRLKEAAEKAKIELSQVQQTQINLPFITATADGPLHLDETLSRAKFQEMTADLIERCRVAAHPPLQRIVVDSVQLALGAVVQRHRFRFWRRCPLYLLLEPV